MRRKRQPRQCAHCGTEFVPPKRTSKFCSIPCRRAVDAMRCKNGHDLTLPGATRPQKGGKASRCVRCEAEAGERYRRRKGVKPRQEFLAGARKTVEQKRETKRLNAERARRRAGVPDRNVVTHKMLERRPIPTELSRAWGRANYGSMMKRKYPTRAALIAAWNRGEIPDPENARLEP
jgi:hypothetical protein